MIIFKYYKVIALINGYPLLMNAIKLQVDLTPKKYTELYPVKDKKEHLLRMLQLHQLHG